MKDASRSTILDGLRGIRLKSGLATLLVAAPLLLAASLLHGSRSAELLLQSAALLLAIGVGIALSSRLQRRLLVSEADRPQASAEPVSGADAEADTLDPAAPERATEAAAAPELASVPDALAAPSAGGAPSGESAEAHLLSDMSHEIHTQLNGLLGASEVLLESELTSEQRRFVGTMMRSGRALQAALDDVLHVSRLASGEVRLEESELDLRARIDEVMDLLARRAQAKGLTLIGDLAADLPCVVKADRARIGQALMSLIGGLLQRADEGELVVSAWVQSRELDRAEIRIEATATHVDVLATIRDRELELFAQSQAPGSGMEGGAGQGLGIVKSMAGHMGGGAGIEMREDSGISLWMTLPLAVVRWEPTDPPPDLGLGGTRLVLAVPQARSREILAGVLGRAGAQVRACASADEAQEILAETARAGSACDALILDSELPGLEALASRARVQGDPLLRDAQRVYLAPAGAGWDAEPLAALSVNACIPKPVHGRQLLDCLAGLAIGCAGSEREALTPNASPGSELPEPLGLKVLVADDNAANQDTVGAMLEVLGCRTRAVFDGQAAVEAYLAEPFDLVLMDCKMPLMDGYEATRRIRLKDASGSGRPVPIIALTAHAMEGDQERCRAAGMDDYLTKPVSLTSLRAALLRWSRERALGHLVQMTPECDVDLDRLADLGKPPPVEALKLDDLEALEILDPAAMDEVKALNPGGEDALVARLVHSFLDSAPGLVVNIRAGLEANRPQQVAESAHSLRSAARILGAIRLSTFCGRLEQFSAAGCTYFPPSHVIEQLELIHAQTCEVVSALLESVEAEGGAASEGAPEPAADAETPAAGLPLRWGDSIKDAEAAEAGTEARDRPLILVVDDNPTIHSVAQSVLERVGLRVAGARDGRGAVEAVRFQRPDLVLLDVMMPDMDGYETCRRLRRVPGLELTPILIMTGLEDTTAIECAYASGATDFYAKPVNWSLLTHRIRYMLRGHATLRALHRSEVRNNALIAAIPDALMRLDSEGRILQYKLGRVLERIGSRADARVERLSDLLPESVCTLIGRELEATLAEHGVRELEIELADTQGDPLMFDARLIAVDVKQVILLLRDMTERRQRQRVIHQLAYQDSLTGLANRQQFNQDLGTALRTARRREDRVALLYLDLDQFKRINDSLGHGVGDELLREAARRLQVAVDDATLDSKGRGSVLVSTVARLGGDELTVILKGRGAERVAGALAERIVERFREPFHCSERIIVCTVSIGIALSPQDGDQPEASLKHADTALYAAKLAGRNTFCFFTASMGELASRRLDIEAGLRQALERDELRIHYQPIVDLASGEILALEALLRWEHPERGLLEPVSFIPVAEESGLILPIGAWVIDEMERQLALWSAEDWAPTICLNVADSQFSDHGLVGRLLGLAERLPRRAIELEITEGVLLARDPRLIDTLTELRAHGLGVAIDRFGTGYSSLSLLKHLPIDTLKIDRTFISEIGQEEASDLLVSTIIGLGRGLGLRVVAEGVETEAQLDFLRREGCDAAQGFLFAAPSAPGALERQSTLRGV